MKTSARPAQVTPAATRRPGSRGFAFTEVLFAVMVLGLGFIMIAAMFPVTLRQTQATVEETSASTVARAAFEALQNCPQLSTAPLPATDTIGSYNGEALGQCPLIPITPDPTPPTTPAVTR